MRFFSVIQDALASLANASRWLLQLGRRRDRAYAEQTGATKQEKADLEDELEERDEQLRESVNRRPGDGHRALRNGTF